jgi:probable selenium-dependent hydroxylase accessory protein YqeC
VQTDDPAAILDAFGLRESRYVFLVGGGGKTSLMFALAHALADERHSVLTTTSTRIRHPEPAESGHLIVGPDAGSLIDPLRSAFETRRHITAAAARLESEEKLGGLAVNQLDVLVEARVADHVLVEADGAAGRSLKAHRDHEPVVSPRADLVIAVVGVDCLGMPMDDLHVHRADLLRERLGRPLGSVVTVHDVSGIFFHRDGYLGRIGKGAKVTVFVSKAGTPEALGDARRLAETLRTADREHRIGRIVVGDVRTGVFHKHGPIAPRPGPAPA